MAKYIRRRISLGLGGEANRGVGVAAAHTVPYVNLTIDAKADKARSAEALGSIVGGGAQAVVTSLRSEGAIEGEVNLRSFPLILEAAIGAVASAADGAAYKHTFTILESNQHPTLSIHIDDPNGDLIFEGCMVDSLALDVVQNEFVKFTAGIKGKKAQAGGYTPSYVADYKLVGRDLTLKVAAAIGDLAAATALSVKELKITINKNVDYDYVLGTLEPEDILNKQMTIQGSLKLNYEDRTWRDYMLNGDYKAVGIDLTNSRTDLGGVKYPALYLELPRVDFSEWEPEGGVDDIAGQTINFNALYDIATSKLISSCYVRNDVTSY